MDKDGLERDVGGGGGGGGRGAGSRMMYGLDDFRSKLPGAGRLLGVMWLQLEPRLEIAGEGMQHAFTAGCTRGSGVRVMDGEVAYLCSLEKLRQSIHYSLLTAKFGKQQHGLRTSCLPETFDFLGCEGPTPRVFCPLFLFLHASSVECQLLL